MRDRGDLWLQLAGAAAILAVTALGQTGNSTISGSVKDPAAAAIPGAKIKITNVESGATIESVSNEAGLYRVGTLLPGNYRVTVDADGHEVASHSFSHDYRLSAWTAPATPCTWRTGPRSTSRRSICRCPRTSRSCSAWCHWGAARARRRRRTSRCPPAPARTSAPAPRSSRPRDCARHARRHGAPAKSAHIRARRGSARS